MELYIRLKDGTNEHYGHPNYQGMTNATRKLKVKIASTATLTCGFTSNTSASAYSPAFYINGTKCYIARYDAVTKTRSSQYVVSTSPLTKSSTYGTSSHNATRSSQYVSRTYSAYKHSGTYTRIAGLYYNYNTAKYTAGYECGEAIIGYHVSYKSSTGYSQIFSSRTVTVTDYASGTYLSGSMTNLNNYVIGLGYCSLNVNFTYKSFIVSSLVYNSNLLTRIRNLEATKYAAGTKTTISVYATRSSQYVVSTTPLTRASTYATSSHTSSRQSGYTDWVPNCNM